jgi:hypothetical protein
MNTEQFPSSPESAASARPSRHFSARLPPTTRGRTRQRVRAGADSGPSAASPGDLAAPVTGAARTEAPRAQGPFDVLAARIDERDRPLLAMLLAGEHSDEMAQVMGLGAEALRLRVQALVAALGAALGEASRGERPAGFQAQIARVPRTAARPMACASVV